MLAIAAAACGDPEATPAADAEAGADALASEAEQPPDRPERITDTVMVEGMPETMQLRLYRTPEDFPLGFSAYVPEDMQPEGSAEGGGASVRFVADYGDDEDAETQQAFVHLFVFPPGTDANAAIGSARGYTASRGVPVSMGIEPLGGEGPAVTPPWAFEAYRFNYEVEDRWFNGTIGVGEHEGRLFQLVVHYPEELAEGFEPRAELIRRSWRWADGEQLVPSGAPAELPDTGSGP